LGKLEKLRNRLDLAVVDPCEDARKESMRCLDKNNYNRDACTEFFKSYRECKKKWLNQRRDDRRAGMDV
jgi:cytochrome c oxidase assembly protein subunit 23